MKRLRQLEEENSKLKQLRRLYREERLQVRRRGGRKRALGTRAPMAVPQGPHQRWSLDFVSDTLTDSRRFRILTVVDDFTRECLALVADNSLSGLRVGRELDAVIARRGKPQTVRRPAGRATPAGPYPGTSGNAGCGRSYRRAGSARRRSRPRYGRRAVPSGRVRWRSSRAARRAPDDRPGPRDRRRRGDGKYPPLPIPMAWRAVRRAVPPPASAVPAGSRSWR